MGPPETAFLFGGVGLGAIVEAAERSLGRAVVWAPARMVRDVAGLPPEPHALALWLAERLGASQLDWALPKGAAMPATPADFAVPTRRL